MKRLIKWLYLQTHKKERAAFRAKIKLIPTGSYRDFRGVEQSEFSATYFHTDKMGRTCITHTNSIQDLLDALGV